MIKFILKGILRDRSRSLFPLITVISGVMLTVLGYCWLGGAQESFFESIAKFETGHLQIMSRAYAEEADQIPNDLAYIGVGSLLEDLKSQYPELIWTPRIKFGGLLDIPDEEGETRDQGPVAGFAVDLFSSETPEKIILNLEEALVRGHLPEKPGEILISDGFARKLNVAVGETATLIGVTMYGGMAAVNFTVSGTVRFGVTVMDRGAMLADITDIQAALDMEDAAGEILGFLKDFTYRDEEAEDIKTSFNARYSKESDEFSPIMGTLLEKSGMSDVMAMLESFSGIIIIIFIAVLSIVLWNAGLIGSLRRYGEIGVRLAMGERKSHLYSSVIAESLMIGFIGSILGTVLGLVFSYYLQVHGLDISSMMENATIMISDVMRAKVTPASFYIGFIPGMAATLLGASIAGIGIYRRKTSMLMKELEA